VFAVFAVFAELTGVVWRVGKGVRGEKKMFPNRDSNPGLLGESQLS
jgi:hypothetical protein